MTFGDVNIDQMVGLENRTIIILQDAKIKTIGDLMRLTAYECRMIPRLGQAGFQNVAYVLIEKYGKKFKDT